jgi:hypothetical protein
MPPKLSNLIRSKLISDLPLVLQLEPRLRRPFFLGALFNAKSPTMIARVRALQLCSVAVLVRVCPDGELREALRRARVDI